MSGHSTTTQDNNFKLMRLVCGWCGSVLRDGPSRFTSTGMCASCSREFERRARARLSSDPPVSTAQLSERE